VKSHRALTSIFGVALVFGCNASKPGALDNPDAASELAADAGSSAADAGSGLERAKATVGPAGGTISAGGALLSIPPGALAADTEIAMSVSADPAPAGFAAYSPLYRFEPEGLAFTEPASISIPFSIPAGGDPNNPGNDPRLATIFWSRRGASGFERTAAKIAGGVATASVTHFSAGFAANGVAYVEPAGSRVRPYRRHRPKTCGRPGGGARPGLQSRGLPGASAGRPGVRRGVGLRLRCFGGRRGARCGRPGGPQQGRPAGIRHARARRELVDGARPRLGHRGSEGLRHTPSARPRAPRAHRSVGFLGRGRGADTGAHPGLPALARAPRRAGGRRYQGERQGGSQCRGRARARPASGPAGGAREAQSGGRVYDRLRRGRDGGRGRRGVEDARRHRSQESAPARHRGDAPAGHRAGRPGGARGLRRLEPALLARRGDPLSGSLRSREPDRLELQGRLCPGLLLAAAERKALGGGEDPRGERGCGRGIRLLGGGVQRRVRPRPTRGALRGRTAVRRHALRGLRRPHLDLRSTRSARAQRSTR
jgi:hypothetical protein